MAERQYPPDIYDKLWPEEVGVISIGNDDQYTEYTVEEYTPTGSVSLSGGSGIFVDPDGPAQPIVGKKIRLYGRGFGFSVRGIRVETLSGDWVTLRYRTPKESMEDHYDWVQEQQQKREQEYAQQKEQREIKIACLPEVFRDRVDFLRAKDPRFIYDAEPYEVFIYEQATVIAAACGSPEAIDQFRELSFEEQYQKIRESGEQVAEEFKDHSGNTFGCACAFAKKLLTDMESLRPPRNEDGTWKI